MEDSKKHDENWDAQVEEEEIKEQTRKESEVKEVKEVKEAKEEEQPKIEIIKEVFLKDKHGNICITHLGDYVEPSRGIKEARANEMTGNYNVFKDAVVYESDDDDVKNTGVSYGEFISISSETKPKKDKKQKPKKGEDDGLDDLLKEFGVDNIPQAQVKKVVEPKKKAEVKPKPVEEAKPVETKEKEAKIEEDKAKKKAEEKKKAAPTKSHLDDAKREIKEKQEALKKKNKKKGI